MRGRLRADCDRAADRKNGGVDACSALNMLTAALMLHASGQDMRTLNRLYSGWEDARRHGRGRSQSFMPNNLDACWRRSRSIPTSLIERDHAFIAARGPEMWLPNRDWSGNAGACGGHDDSSEGLVTCCMTND